MSKHTSIQISPRTRERLAELKGGRSETYDEVINKLLELVPKGDEEGEYTKEFRIGLLNARLDLKRGKKVGLSEAKKKLGV